MDLTYFLYNDEFESNGSYPFLEIAWETNGDKNYQCYDLMPDNNAYFVFRTISGEGEININGKIYTVNSDNILISIRKDIVYYKTKGSNWHFYLFEFSSFDERDVLYKDIKFTESEFAVIDEMCNAISEGNQELCQNAFKYLLSKWDSIGNRTKVSFVSEIAKYISSAPIGESLEIGKIASKFNVCERTLRKHFKEIYKMTPNEFILNRNFKIAALLLKTTGFKIKEIAEKTGFQNEYYFSTAFKKRFGVSPLEFRKKS